MKGLNQGIGSVCSTQEEENHSLLQLNDQMIKGEIIVFTMKKLFQKRFQTYL